MSLDNGFKGDSLRQSRGHRVAYLVFLAVLCIGFALFMPNVQAETLKVISNTDICSFNRELMLDYCKTEYEICDVALDTKKVDFQFKVEKDPTLRSQIDDLTYNYTFSDSKANCKIVTVEGYKNPFKNVDNILCYDSNCHEEFVWWNTSFISKFPIFGNISTGNLTLPILVNDSCLTIDGKIQCVWCNYTLNTTRQIIGYFYFTNISMYQCVDITDTFAVEMQVETGNESDFGNPFEKDITLLLHFNESVDSSIYQLPVVENSFENNERVAGKIGFGNFYDGDYLSIANHPSVPQEMSIMFWANIPAGSLSETVVPSAKYDVYSWGNINYVIRLIDSGSDGIIYIGDSGPGNFHFMQFDNNNITADIWEHWTLVVNGSDFIRLYKNGTLIMEKSIASGIDTSTVTLYVGFETVVSDDFTIDEFRFYNRTLSSDEISSIYDNQVGDLNFTFQGDIENFSQNTSVKHFDLDVPSFLVTSQNYQTIINDTFTFLNDSELVIKGSGGVRKQAGTPLTSLLSARLTFNGVVLFDESIRSVIGASDRGIFTLPISNVSSVAGVNNLLLEMKRSGNDDLNITNLGIHVDTEISNDGFTIANLVENAVFNFTSTSYVNVYNFTIVKPLESNVLVDVDHKFQSTSNNIVGECYLESFSTGERTDITYERWLESSGDVGSSGVNYRSSNAVNASETWMMFCKSSTNNQMNNNVTVYILDMLDANNNTINGFQNSSQISGLTGSGNVLLSNEYANEDGTQLEVLVTIIMQSTSGSQDGSVSPTFIIRNDDDSCRTEFQRSLSSNSDIGTAKVYVNCENITLDQLNTYQMIVDVGGGETLDILNVSISTYEASPQIVIEGIVPPIVAITNPTNETVAFGSMLIEALVIDISRIGWASQIFLYNATGSLVFIILNETTFGNTTQESFNTLSVINGNYTVEWIVTNGFGNNTDNISFVILNVPPPSPPDIVFCIDDDTLFIRETENTTINGNQSVQVIDKRISCQFGCSNSTLQNWGYAGCKESDFQTALYFFAVIILIVVIIRVAK